MSIKLGMICNRRSRRLQRRWQRIAPLLDSTPTVSRHDLHGIDGLTEAMDILAREKVDAIAVLGGDGTVQAVAGHLINRQIFGSTPPPLIVLPGGTTNLIARELGIQGSTASALNHLNRWLAAPHFDRGTVTAPLLSLSVDAGSDPYHGFVFGTAAFYEGTLMARRQVQSLGFADDLAAGISTVAAVVKVLLGRGQGNALYRPHAIEFHHPGQPAEAGEYFFALASTLQQLVWNMRPFWGRDAGQTHSGFHLTTVEFPPRRLLRALMPMLFGKPKPWMTEAGYRSRYLDHVTMRLQCPVLLDGEVFHPGPDGITLYARHHLRFVRLAEALAT